MAPRRSARARTQPSSTPYPPSNASDNNTPTTPADVLPTTSTTTRGARNAQSKSASRDPQSDSPDAPPSTTNGNGKAKRKPRTVKSKIEPGPDPVLGPIDDAIDEDEDDADATARPAVSAERDLPPSSDQTMDDPDHDPDGDDDEDGGGVTRCLCGRTDDQTGALMIQCDECQTWQHCPCMGYENNDDVPETYYCELCRPELHVELLKRQTRSSKHKRTPSSASALNYTHAHPLGPGTSPTSPTHSNAHDPSGSPLLNRAKSPKRRATMNSSSAAFDAGLGILGVSAAAGAASAGTEDGASVVAGEDGPVLEEPQRRKRRKRGADDLDENAPTPPATSLPRPRARANPTPSKRTRQTKPHPTSPGGSPPAQSLNGNGGQEKGSTVPDHLSHLSFWFPRFQLGVGVGEDEIVVTSATSLTSTTTTSGTSTSTASLTPVPYPPMTTSLFASTTTTTSTPTHPENAPHLLGTPSLSLLNLSAKVRWPAKRTTVAEMRKRGRAMMEYCTRMQVEVGVREERMRGLGLNLLPMLTEGAADGDMDVDSAPAPADPAKQSDQTRQTLGLLLHLTDELVKFQENWALGGGKKREGVPVMVGSGNGGRRVS